MSITVTFYQCSDAPNVVNKNFAVVGTATVAPVHPCSLMQPSFILDNNSNFYNCNYFSFEGNYYKMTMPTLTTGQRMMISGTIDVLSSYASAIKSADATIVRSESIGKPTYIPDSSLPVNPVSVDLESLVFTGGTPLGVTSSFLLQTMGGSGA